MKEEKIFSRKTQNRYLSAAKIICLSFLFSIPAEAFVKAADLSSVETVQQQNVVKGVVLDVQGEPVIGASVTIKGGTLGTITDINGNFSLTAPVGSQLVVSFIGYVRQSVTHKAGQSLKVVLQEDTKILDEVIIMGYGSQKAKNVTGSVAQIATKDIQDIPVSNLAESLSGQVAGLSVSGGSGRPGDTAGLSIRQSFSYSKDGGNENPLIIIDDVIQVDPSNGLSSLSAFNALDPSEVESITVLRDASAAIYGSRASQGAIIVKTKRGKSGTPQINYSGKFGLTDAVSHSKTLNSYEYGKFANSFLLASRKVNPDNEKDRAAKLFSNDELERMKGLDYNWLDEAWKPAFTMNHSLNVSGGTDKATYFAGASYYDQGANLGKQSYTRWTFRAGVDVNISSNLKFSASVSGNQGERIASFTKNVGSLSDGSYGSKAGGSNADYGYLLHLPRYIPWKVEVDGEEYYTSPALGPHAASGNATSANQIGGWNYFALLDNNSISTDKSSSWNANFSMTYNVPFVKGLSVRATYASSRSSSDNEQRAMPFTLALNKGMQAVDKHLYDAEFAIKDWQMKENNKNSRVVYGDNIGESRQMNFFMNYERQFDNHHISGMFSLERADSYTHSKTMQYDFPTKDYLGTSASAGTLSPEHSVTNKSESGTLSYLGRINYSYADRYMLQFVFRADASTKFAPENYWGFFPGISAGWVVSEEAWFKEKMYWFEYLKVRGSWGKTGKDNMGAWGWKQTFDYASDKGYLFGPNGGLVGSSLSSGKTPNRDAHWDTTHKFNFGLDTRFLDGRFGANMDVYYDKNTDMLNKNMASILGTPIFIGGSFAEQNFGRIDAYGAEFSLSWRDKIGQLGYSLNVNFGMGGNKVKEWPVMAPGYPSANTVKAGGPTQTFMPAWGFKVWRGTSTGDGILRSQEDIDNYWAYLTEHANAAGTSPKFLGISKKDEVRKGMLAYQDLNGPSVNGQLTGADGQIDKDIDYDKLATSQKSHGFSTRLGLNWKGIDFSAQISTSWGGGIRTVDAIKIGTSSNQMFWSPESYWSEMYDETSNPLGRYPNLGHGDNVILDSDFWTISTFRCYVKSLTIGYSLPKKWLKPIYVQSAKLSLVGNNLWDFYNPYPDHYRNMYDSSYANYPTLRNWSLAVNLSF